MRKLKIKLADDNEYTFCTLTRRQVGAIQKKQKNNPLLPRIKELQAKEEEEDGLESADLEELTELQESEEVYILEMLRMALAKNHPEFALTDDEDKEQELNDKVADLMDMRDMGILSTFVVTGTVQIEEDAVVKNTDIVMS
jgi:hypothetical protein